MKFQMQFTWDAALSLLWALDPAFLSGLVCISENLQLCMACKPLSVHFNSVIGISETWT